MNQKGFMNLVLIGIVILLVIGGGYFVWSKKIKKDIKLDVVANNVIEDTSGWKTYINSQYGFEFKYPQDWIYSDDINFSYTSEEQNSVRGITFCEAYSGTSRCEVYKQFLIDWENGNAVINDPHGGTIGLSLKKTKLENKEIFRKILSTFKFTK